MTRFLHHLAPALALAGFTVLTACGGGGSGGGSPNAGAPSPGTPSVERYAIASAYTGGAISSFAVDTQSGQMRLVDKESSGLNLVTSVALRPGHNDVISLSYEGGITQYTLSERGELSIHWLVDLGSKGNDVIIHPSGDFAYVADSDVGIYQLAFDENAMLSTLSPNDSVAAEPGAMLTDLAITSNGQHVYAADMANDQIAIFNVEQDGSLTYVDSYATGDGPYSLALQPARNLLYVANRNDGTLDQFQIQANGHLQAIAPALQVANSSLESVVIDNSGSFLYAADLPDDKIWQFRIGEDGAVIPLDTPSISVDSKVVPRTLKVSPVSDRLYLSDGNSQSINGNGAAMIPFYIDEAGELNPMTIKQIAMDAHPSDLVFTTGKALTAHNTAAYVINSGEDNVSQFLLDDDGALTPFGENAPATGDNPTDIAAHPTGKYIYVANYNDDTVSQFRRVTSSLVAQEIDELEEIGGGDIATDLGPAALAVHPSGNHLYVANKDNNSITRFNIAASGVLSIEANEDPYQVGFADPTDLVIDPSGRFLWVVTDTLSSRVIPFAINALDGSLTRLDDFIRATGASAKSITITPDGQELYTSFSSGMEKFLVDNDTGAITSNASESGNGIIKVLVSPLDVLYAVSEVDQSIGWFSEVAGSVATDSIPAGLAVAPTGEHLLLAIRGNEMMTRFAINGDGSLIAEESVAVGNLPVDVTIVGYTE